MRKLQQVAAVVAAAGSLSAIGTGVSFADTPVRNGAAPQLSPQVSERLSPQIAPREEQNNIFRPYQECSPQTVGEANVPIGVLAVPRTHAVSCGQFNGGFIA